MSAVTDECQLLTFSSRKQWRTWLEANHGQITEARLVLYKKGTCECTFSLGEAVEEALCFGWIDGKLKNLDSQRYSLRFSPRKAGSVWSIRNIRRAEKLIKAGLMTKPGMQKVTEARQNGQWDAAINREQTDLIPIDLEKALNSTRRALDGYHKLSTSRKKQLLHWLQTAKRVETRQARIEAIVNESLAKA